MTVKWFQLVGGSDYDRWGRPVISEAATSRAWKAYPEIEDHLMSKFDGARWLLQGGFERVSIGF